MSCSKAGPYQSRSQRFLHQNTHGFFSSKLNSCQCHIVWPTFHPAGFPVAWHSIKPLSHLVTLGNQTDPVCMPKNEGRSSITTLITVKTLLCELAMYGNKMFFLYSRYELMTIYFSFF